MEFILFLSPSLVLSDFLFLILTMKEIINTYTESASSVVREVKAKWTDGY